MGFPSLPGTVTQQEGGRIGIETQVKESKILSL